MNSDKLLTVLGIIGYPLSHSLSPLMHNTGISHYKMNCRYVPFEVHPDELSNAIKGLKSLGIKGVNVTIPHKEQVIQHLDEISKEARLIGAVNTISLEDGKLKGDNTDGVGFVSSLVNDASINQEGKNVLILGAGGAARGIAVQLALSRIKTITIANRSGEKAEKLASYMRENVKQNLPVITIPFEKKSLASILSGMDIIVNTTSQGMSGKNDIVNFPYDELSEKHLVVDIVYNPLETYFLKMSKKRGANILNGLGMLIYQGSRSFEIWTKKRLPVSIIAPILKKVLT